jgi:hypothetical protein
MNSNKKIFHRESNKQPNSEFDMKRTHLFFSDSKKVIVSDGYFETFFQFVADHDHS